MEPAQHDVLVALVSHVPQLAASTLMDVATARGGEHRTLLRLAAGGFRDMTRIAAGHPGIWPDILDANRDAVLQALDDYRDALGAVRELVVAGDRQGMLDLLERARAARRSLPVGTPPVEELAELRIPVPDRQGVLAEITTLAGRLGVNVFDLEIAHSGEGGAGVLVLVATGHRCRRARSRPPGARLPRRQGSTRMTASEVVVGGAQPLRGRLRVPGDKSISHRALLFAALADGRSTIAGLATGADVAATRRSLELLGVRVTESAERLTVGAKGVDALREPEGVIDCANSGTAMRILSGLLAGRPFLSVLDGDASLRGDRWRAWSNRCARWVRRSTRAPAAPWRPSLCAAARWKAGGTRRRLQARR